jgi:hypothetical protein
MMRKFHVPEFTVCCDLGRDLCKKHTFLGAVNELGKWLGSGTQQMRI